MNNLTYYTYNNSTLDYGILDGNPIFNLNYIAKILDISSPRTSIDTKNSLYIVKVRNNNSVGGSTPYQNNFVYNRKLNNRGELFLTEVGLYKLLFRSKKPAAEKFVEYIANQVLPNIRKSTNYVNSIEKTRLKELVRLAQNEIKLLEENKELQDRIAEQKKVIDVYNGQFFEDKVIKELRVEFNKNVKKLAIERFDSNYEEAFKFIYTEFRRYYNFPYETDINIDFISKKKQYLITAIKLIIYSYGK